VAVADVSLNGISAIAYRGGALLVPRAYGYTRVSVLDPNSLALLRTDFAVFALLVATLVWLAVPGLERKSSREHLWIYAGSTYALAGLVWFNSMSGFVITLTRGVP
jgi:hypothetical protein